MILRRLKILYRYLSNPTLYSYTSLKEVLHQMFLPTSRIIARQQIIHVEEVKGYQVVHLRETQVPLYWPTIYARSMLHHMICETYLKTNPHYYEAPETQVLPGDVVVDCGASEGLFTLNLIERAKKCYLIEPLPAFQEALAYTFAGIPDIEILPVALGDRPTDLLLKEDILLSWIDETEGTIPVHV